MSLIRAAADAYDRRQVRRYTEAIERDRALHPPAPEPWQCSRCAAVNPAQQAVCTGCGTREDQPGYWAPVA